MPKGNLVVQLSDMAGAAVKGPIEVDFRRVEGSPGAGGQNMEVSVKGPLGSLTVTGIPCQTGPGTMYEVRVSAPHHRKYAFFQLIQEDRDNTATDDVEFWVKPGDVAGVQAPAFVALHPAVRTMCDQAVMIADRPEDRELLGVSSGDLYRQMGPLRQACLLNIAKKASDARTAGNCLPHIRGLLISRQDRLFARVDPALVQVVQQGAMFKSAPGKLHTPPPGFAMSPAGSFKSKDPHANLQVTFMAEIATGDLAADIDIDEASGIEHGFEVIRNALFKNRTNPYLIREFLNAADFTGRSLSPEYAFTFRG